MGGSRERTSSWRSVWLDGEEDSQRGQRGESSTVPGLQDPYESPLNPEVIMKIMSIKLI